MSFSYKTILNFLTKEECKLLLDFSIKNLNLHPADIISTSGSDNLNYNEKNKYRKSNVNFYPYYEKFPFLLEKITNLVDDILKVKGHTLDYKKSEFQFTEYNEGDFFDWHVDITEKHLNTIESNRYCSIVIQLNDGYYGGDLEINTFENNIYTMERGIGNLIIFLSEMKHRVTSVTNGKRYTLVNWVSLQEINNYKKTLL